MITSGGTTTLGLYDNASEIRKKADITYVDSRVGDFQAQVVSLAGGHLGYATLALATTASTGLPANTVLEVTNDPTTANNGLYLWDGTTLTKSDFDPLTQAKTYTDTKVDAVIKDTDISVPTIPLVDVDGWFYGAFYEDGSLETPLFKINREYENFHVIDQDGWVLLEQQSNQTPIQPPYIEDWSGKNIMLFGDSITETSNVDAGVYDSTAYRSNWFVHAKTMLNVLNFRNFAKSGASYREYVGQLDFQKISHQISTAIGTSFMPDIVVIACGTNDGVTMLGDYDTAMAKDLASLDMSLTADALRKNLYEINKAYPNAKLFSCLPLQRGSIDTPQVQPLLDLIKKMSGRYGFTVIDCFNESGIVRDFEKVTQYRDTSDSLHPNTGGQIKQAKLISAKIKSNYQSKV